MTDRTLEADYLIVGAGAVGMAFADTLLTDSDATMIIVDRRHKPGGHWNDAYPFVRLQRIGNSNAMLLPSLPSRRPRLRPRRCGTAAQGPLRASRRRPDKPGSPA